MEFVAYASCCQASSSPVLHRRMHYYKIVLDASGQLQYPLYYTSLTR